MRQYVFGIWGAIFGSLWLLAYPVLAQDITIKVDGIGSNIPVEVSSGWPLTINLYANNPIGILYDYPPPSCPFQTFTAFSQQFPTLLPALQQPGGPPPPPNCQIPPNELASVLFNGGSALDFLPGPISSAPVNSPPQLSIGTKFSTTTVPLPPLSGGNYGLNPSLPGLVILTDAGTGLVFDETFELANPLQERNVAGFISSVLYTLNNENTTANQGGQLVITAQMAVPPELFVPIVEVDDIVGHGPNVGQCPGVLGIGCATATWEWRIDGGKITSGGAGDLLTALNQRLINIRIFVVNGNAPSELSDLNNDGIVDSKDAELAGYNVISNEVDVQVRNYRQNLGGGGCPTNTIVIEGSLRTDLDGNRLFTTGLFFAPPPNEPCSPGSTHLTPIPR